ncbi:hypothetical protein RirG_141490 [Rhizophagus irregularis DAOM 197198w]|uniref:Uncharacterized protein n=1 Tax=Rhizophagus irregularis (strain DAOM 197198w) TaxID=1432141 RepID=A0A015J4Y1_RHIIW|nr:hypothetical protein RirG_141490 [Rhizophagus irregularis DAOM 197198w]
MTLALWEKEGIVGVTGLEILGVSTVDGVSAGLEPLDFAGDDIDLGAECLGIFDGWVLLSILDLDGSLTLENNSGKVSGVETIKDASCDVDGVGSRGTLSGEGPGSLVPSNLLTLAL